SSYLVDVGDAYVLVMRSLRASQGLVGARETDLKGQEPSRNDDCALAFIASGGVKSVLAKSVGARQRKQGRLSLVPRQLESLSRDRPVQARNRQDGGLDFGVGAREDLPDRLSLQVEGGDYSPLGKGLVDGLPDALGSH